MSSSKLTRALAALTVLVLTAGLSAGCASDAQNGGEALYRDVSSSFASSSYKLFEVKTGDLSRNISGEGTLIYPDSERITCAGYSGATLVSVNVKNGDAVAEGDVIAEFSRKYSQADLDSLYSNLEITKDQLSMQRSGLERAVKAAESALAAARSGYSAGTNSANDVTRAELRLESAKIDLSLFESTEKRTIEAQQSAIDAFEASIADTQLIAKRSGVVADVMYLAPGSAVSDSTEICTIYSPDVFWLGSATDISNAMRYNQPIEITVTKGTKTYSGRIVSAPNILSQSTGQVTILPDDIGAELAATLTDRMKRITVVAPRFRLENVLIVPVAAVANEEGSRYVYVYEDGILKKRYVTVGSKDTEYIQILDGLEAGQMVVVG